MYKNYLKQKQIEWRETAKEKKKTEKMIFSLDWLYQPGLEVVALGLGLEPPLVPVGISNRD